MVHRAKIARGWPVILTGLVVLLAGPVRADLTCRADVDRDQVAPGGRIVLTLHAEGDLRQQPTHEAPRIDGVDVVPGGTSQSFSMDATGSHLAYDVTYYLQVRRTTSFRIPAVTFRSADQHCSTTPIAISVDASGLPPAQTGNRTPQPGGAGAVTPEPRAAGGAAGDAGDPAFITLTVDKRQVWVGEQLVLVFRYYRQRSTWDQPTYTPPRTEGFWRVDLPPERNYRANVRGLAYEVTEIRYALFATRAGRLVIEPATLSLAVDPFERLFGRRSRSPRQLVTPPIELDVRELPLPRPANFSGVVASQLDFTATVDRETVPRGEPVALAMKVVADGFLKSFEGLRLPETEGLRLHEASESLREDVTGPRYQATFRQETAVVPTREGTVPLPPLELVYFDTGKGAYRTNVAPVPPLVVTASDLPAAGDGPSGFLRAEIARLGRDLAFIHPASGPVRRLSPSLIERPLWWLGLLAPGILLVGYRLRLRRQAADLRDPTGQRRRRAWPQARRALAQARRSGDAADLARGIVDYVAAHSGAAPAGLSAGAVREWCAGLGQPESGRRLAEILAECDQSRFGGRAALDVPARADEAERLLAGLEPAAPRGGRGWRTVTGLWLAVSLAATAVAGAQERAPAAGPDPGIDPARLLAEGNRAYTDGDLTTAVERYRNALDLGADDATLHYNLGNAYARSGELGRAIASYLRAQRLDPRDLDTRTNLAWIRSHTRDLELAGHDLPPVVAQLDAAVHSLTLDEWATALVVLTWAAAALVAWSWRRGWLSVGLRRVLLLGGACWLVAAVVTATRVYEEHWRDTAIVIAPEVEVRSGPATTFPVVFRIHDGLGLVVRGEREGWARIGLGGDWVGWVPAETLERVRRGARAPVQGR
ncbi:MAG TPA: BatD family protein [Candidatus Krumholzibacteria bacterium]|nr:BatD family protein [Candidatus Krumholzibacteria bacterium]HPD71204.1 BatD family protein [Candidatus Krumholzibacteria bacterium]HRY39096.1 BatD family protein [Candidatus Krumholzibacteria bacterium]